MNFGTDHPHLDPIAGLRADADRIVELDTSEMPDARIATDLVRLRRQMDRLEAGRAEWALAADRRGVGIADGFASTRAWLSWKSGRTQGEINRLIRTAQAIELLEETGAAWRAGEITSAAVAMIADARVDGHDDEYASCEREFLDFARRRDHRSLRIVTRHFRKCALADGSAPDVPDGLTISPVGDRVAVRGDFATDAAETITHALDQFTTLPTANDGSTRAQRLASALVRVCEVALGRGTGAELARPAAFYVTNERAPDAAPPLTLGQFTGVVDPRDRERLLCDATITKIRVGSGGMILDVGRATRIWPTAIRKAIVVRDGCCVWPGCEVPATWCDVHHHECWEHGGCTAVHNGMLLCRAHHTFLHRHPDWRTTFVDQHFRVFRPNGHELHPDPWFEPSPDDPPDPHDDLTRAA